MLYGVTVASSARAFLGGQLGYFRDRGWEVHLVCSPDPSSTGSPADAGVTHHPLPTRRGIDPSADLRSLWAWLTVLRRVRPEVTNVGTPKAGLIGGLAARLTGVPVRVYTVHGLRFEGASGITRTLLQTTERLAIACATDVVAVSPSVHVGLLALGVDPAKVHVVGSGSANGVDGDRVRSRVLAGDREEILGVTGRHPAGFTAGYVGRLNPDKGIDHLVAALDRLAGAGRVVPLVCVGAPDAHGDDRALDAARFPVVRAGWAADPHRFLAAVDVLVLPTRREGMPTVVLEAAAAGIPTITTDVTGARDAVIDGRTGLLVPYGDVAALARAIERLADDAPLRRQLGRQAQERVAAEFDPRTVWEGLERIVTARLGALGRAVPEPQARPGAAPTLVGTACGDRRRRPQGGPAPAVALRGG